MAFKFNPITNKFDLVLDKAYEILTDTTNFDKALSSADDTVQKALDTLDELVGGVLQDKIVLFQPDQSHNYNDYRVHQVSNAGNSNFTFKVPDDFVSLVNIHVHFIPNVTILPGETIDIMSNYAGLNELSNTHAEAIAAHPITGTADILSTVDVDGIFTNLSPGDLCGFNWKNNQIGTTISILVIEMHYNAI